MQRQSLSQPITESVLTLLCFGSDANAVECANILDPQVVFGTEYNDIASRVVSYVIKYGCAPGRAHIDDIFDHVLKNPDDARRSVYHSILLSLLRQAEHLNEQFVLDRLGEFMRDEVMKATLLAGASRWEQGRDGAAHEVIEMLEHAIEQATRLEENHGMLTGFQEPQEQIPPRQWLLGRSLCRGYLSTLSGDGGTGKTALAMLRGVAMATGRELTGEQVYQPCRVLYVSFEDSQAELQRRLRAVMLHYGIDAAELGGRLTMSSLASANLRFLTRDEFRLERRLERTLKGWEIDACILDPFVKSHHFDENDNGAIDRVCSLILEIATRCNCAIEVLHHTSKSSEFASNSVDKMRGASALKNAARIAEMIARVPPKVIEAFGIDPQVARYLRTVDDGKLNLSEVSDHAKWFRMVSVDLLNGDKVYESDKVQTFEAWECPDVRTALTSEAADRIIEEIGKGTEDGWCFSAEPQATTHGAWRVVAAIAEGDLPEAQCRRIVRKWVADGVLEEFEYRAPNRHLVKGLRVSPR